MEGKEITVRHVYLNITNTFPQPLRLIVCTLRLLKELRSYHNEKYCVRVGFSIYIKGLLVTKVP